jgi:hypothetical protein
MDVSHRAGGWTLEKRLADTIKLKEFTYDWDNLSKYTQRTDNDTDEIKDAIIEADLPLAKVFFHCAPCACAIQTALAAAANMSTRLLQVLVRVDDRIVPICCAEEDKRKEALSSILTVVEDCVAENPGATLIGNNLARCLDRPWLEQRLFCLENESYKHFLPAKGGTRLAEIFADYNRESTQHCAGIVVLGELDYCVQVMQLAPFPWQSRIPQVREIYQMKPGIFGIGWTREFLGKFVVRPPHRNQHTLQFQNSFYGLTKRVSLSPPPEVKRIKTSPSAIDHLETESLVKAQSQDHVDTVVEGASGMLTEAMI